MRAEVPDSILLLDFEITLAVISSITYNNTRKKCEIL